MGWLWPLDPGIVSLRSGTSSTVDIIIIIDYCNGLTENYLRFPPSVLYKTDLVALAVDCRLLYIAFHMVYLSGYFEKKTILYESCCWDWTAYL